jgi:hypothetical protein
VPARPRGRRTIAELLQAQASVELERDLLAWVVAELERLRACRRIRRWHHVPDVRRTRKEQEGMLDLHIGVRRDLVIALELKRPDGRGVVSEAQQDWLDCWGDRGALCQSRDEVLAHLKRWGVVG